MKDERLAAPSPGRAARASRERFEVDDDPEGVLGHLELRAMFAERDAATARFRELKRRLLRRR